MWLSTQTQRKHGSSVGSKHLTGSRYPAASTFPMNRQVWYRGEIAEQFIDPHNGRWATWTLRKPLPDETEDQFPKMTEPVRKDLWVSPDGEEFEL